MQQVNVTRSALERLAQQQCGSSTEAARSLLPQILLGAIPCSSGAARQPSSSAHAAAVLSSDRASGGGASSAAGSVPTGSPSFRISADLGSSGRNWIQRLSLTLLVRWVVGFRF